MCFEDARIIFLNKEEGFSQLAAKLRAKNFTVTSFELIILLIGHNDVRETDKNFFEGVESVLEVVQSQNSSALIVLCATLPSNCDTHPMINTFSFRNNKIAGRCTVEDLLGAHGPIPDYFDETGDINKMGCDVMARAQERKIFSARLFQRHREMRASQQ